MALFEIVCFVSVTQSTLNFPITPVANRVLPAVSLRSYTPY